MLGSVRFERPTSSSRTRGVISRFLLKTVLQSDFLVGKASPNKGAFCKTRLVKLESVLVFKS